MSRFSPASGACSRLAVLLALSVLTPIAASAQQGRITFDNRTSMKLDTEIDGYLGCATPVLSKSVCDASTAPGNHLLVVKGPGRWKKDTTVSVEAGKTKIWTITEEGDSGVVAITSPFREPIRFASSSAPDSCMGGEKQDRGEGARTETGLVAASRSVLTGVSAGRVPLRPRRQPGGVRC